MYYVRRALKKFVDEQMRPGDLVAIMRTSAGMGAFQQFTSDKRLLHRAIEGIKWNPRGRAGIGAFAAIEADPLAEAREQSPDGGLDEEQERKREREREQRERERDLRREADEFREDIFTVGTLGALHFIVRALKELPGRKSVIMFSDGFEIYRRDGTGYRVREQLRRLADLAGRSSVVINTVDARGLQTLGLTAEDNVTGVGARQVAAAISERGSKLFNTQAGLSYLAEETGGLFVRNNNDLPGAVRRTLEAQKSYYLVGFRPDDSLFDQERGRVRFNEVEVKVLRAGLRTRTRGGFYGFTEDEARPVPRTRREQMAAALFSPFAAGAVPLRLTSLFESASAKENSVASLLHIDVSGFRFEEEADGWKKAVLDVVALTFGENGQVLDEVNRTETVRARGEAFDHLMRSGLVYTLRAPVRKPGAYQLRVVVRDAASEKVGSASQFIEVPDLKKERLALSGLVLSAPQDAGAETGVPAAGAKAPASAAGEDAKFMSGPAVRRFRRGAEFEYYFAIYNAKTDRATGRPRLTTQTRLFRDGRPVFTGGVTPYDAAGQTDVRRLPAAS
jgi:VWFA-related protein